MLQSVLDRFCRSPCAALSQEFCSHCNQSCPTWWAFAFGTAWANTFIQGSSGSLAFFLETDRRWAVFCRTRLEESGWEVLNRVQAPDSMI